MVGYKYYQHNRLYHFYTQHFDMSQANTQYMVLFYSTNFHVHPYLPL